MTYLVIRCDKSEPHVNKGQKMLKHGLDTMRSSKFGFGLNKHVTILVALIRDTHTLRIDTYFQYVSQYDITYDYDT